MSVSSNITIPVTACLGLLSGFATSFAPYFYSLSGLCYRERIRNGTPSLSTITSRKSTSNRSLQMENELKSRSIKYVQTCFWQRIKSNIVCLSSCAGIIRPHRYPKPRFPLCSVEIFPLFVCSSKQHDYPFLSVSFSAHPLIGLITIIRTSENNTSTNRMAFPTQYNCRDSTRDSLYIRYAI
jgi:hypothetical protein